MMLLCEKFTLRRNRTVAADFLNADAKNKFIIIAVAYYFCYWKSIVEYLHGVILFSSGCMLSKNFKFCPGLRTGRYQF